MRPWHFALIAVFSGVCVWFIYHDFATNNVENAIVQAESSSQSVSNQVFSDPSVVMPQQAIRSAPKTTIAPPQTKTSQTQTPTEDELAVCVESNKTNDAILDQLCSLQTYQVRLEQLSVTDVFAEWQANIMAGNNMPLGKMDITLKVLANKLQQIADDDPLYDSLSALVNSDDYMLVSATAILLSQVATSRAITIAQDLVLRGGPDLGVLGLDALRAMAVTRSVAQWDVGRQNPLPAIKQSITSFWERANGGDPTQIPFHRAAIAKLIAVDGSKEGIDFMMDKIVDQSTDSDTRGMLQNMMGSLQGKEALTVLQTYLDNTSNVDSIAQASAVGLLGMVSPDASASLLSWVSSHATDADVSIVSKWFMDASMHDFPSLNGDSNLEKPHLSSKFIAQLQKPFQSEVVKEEISKIVTLKDKEVRDNWSIGH